MIIQNGAANCRAQETAIVIYRISVDDLLIVVRAGQVDHFARVAQTNRAQGFDFSGFERQHNLVNIGERTSFTLRARLFFGQIVESKHHVLCRHSNGLTRSRGKNVVRRQHQYAGLNLRFRRQRNVNRHLVAVEISIESRADQRVDLDRLAFY